MTTTEKNKLIAEFLHGKNAVHPNQYHENWNELMPVVEKIESFGFTFLTLKSPAYLTYIEKNILDAKNYKGIANTKIESIYNACVEFIQWYNQQNK